MFPKITLPTDSLYKFIALVGIVIIFFSFFPFYEMDKINMEIIEISGEIEEIEIKQKFLNQKAEKAGLESGVLVAISKQIIDGINLDSNHLSFNKELEYILILKEFVIYIGEKKIELLENYNKLQILTERTLTKNRIIDYKNKKLKKDKWIMALMMFVGWYCCLYGFGKWYHKLQKYQDIIVKLQSKEYEKIKK